ncbi:nucleotide exchange factor GrpE [Blautia schinkii]|nr:nucleotide exchange factor GrpE [Blautia schinkii]
MSEENRTTSEMQEEGKDIPVEDIATEEQDEENCDTAECSGENAGAGENEEDSAEEKQEQDNPDESRKEENQEEDKQEKQEGKTKTSFFGKKKKEKDKKDQQIEELTDRLKRNMAEFDNFRKRTEKEKASMYIIGAKEIVEKMLPVVDNFERGLAQAPEGDAFAEGMRMIYKQMMTTFDDLGVKPIDAVGKEFDPNFHNAVMHVDDESVGENIVVEELQKGYTYKDFVVRHSMVKVAN